MATKLDPALQAIVDRHVAAAVSTPPAAVATDAGRVDELKRIAAAYHVPAAELEAAIRNGVSTVDFAIAVADKAPAYAAEAANLERDARIAAISGVAIEGITANRHAHEAEAASEIAHRRTRESEAEQRQALIAEIAAA